AINSYNHAYSIFCPRGTSISRTEFGRRGGSFIHPLHQNGQKNPLHTHTASFAGHVDFAKNILGLKPEFAPEINQYGFYSHAHMAAANGHIKIVKELLQVDPGLCRFQENRRRLLSILQPSREGRR
ncbi:hypothetical protein Tsubulata_042070, partial [Turnera subulata]